jgi:hypothetical protein
MHPIRRGLLWGAAGLIALFAINALSTVITGADDPIPPAPVLKPHTDTQSSEGSSPDAPVEGGPDGNLEQPDSRSGEPDDLSAREMLQSIPIKGRAPKTGYDREGQFGRAWFDVDANGCDTRNDILQRDLDNLVLERECTVLSGTLDDPFSGEVIDFERGETTSILVQIDHVVALSNAWQTGAAQLDAETRLSFANDPLNLIAVSGRLNAQKGDGDAATWLPHNRDFWCEYVARQVAVKAHYDLWVTPPEFERIDTILSECGNPPALTPDQHGMFRPGSLPGF